MKKKAVKSFFLNFKLIPSLFCTSVIFPMEIKSIYHISIGISYSILMNIINAEKSLKYLNFGSVGFIIAHEMSHIFDQFVSFSYFTWKIFEYFHLYVVWFPIHFRGVYSKKTMHCRAV